MKLLIKLVIVVVVVAAECMNYECENEIFAAQSKTLISF